MWSFSSSRRIPSWNISASSSLEWENISSGNGDSSHIRQVWEAMLQSRGPRKCPGRVYLMPSFGLCGEHEINKMKMDSTGNQEASARVLSATNRLWDTLSKSLPNLASVFPFSNERFELLSPKSLLIAVSPEGHKCQHSVFPHLDMCLIRIGCLRVPLVCKL